MNHPCSDIQVGRVYIYQEQDYNMPGKLAGSTQRDRTAGAMSYFISSLVMPLWRFDRISCVCGQAQLRMAVPVRSR